MSLALTSHFINWVALEIANHVVHADKWVRSNKVRRYNTDIAVCSDRIEQSWSGVKKGEDTKQSFA